MKVRRPWTVGALALVTLGIYGLYWYFKANSALRSLGRLKNDSGLNVNPALATFAISLSYLVIVPNIVIGNDALAYLLAGLAAVPFLVSWYRTVRRVRRAQELDGLTRRLSVPPMMILVVLTAGPIPPLPLAVELSWTLAGLVAVFLLYRTSQVHLNAIWVRCPRVT